MVALFSSILISQLLGIFRRARSYGCVDFKKPWSKFLKLQTILRVKVFFVKKRFEIFGCVYGFFTQKSIRLDWKKRNTKMLVPNFWKNGKFGIIEFRILITTENLKGQEFCNNFIPFLQCLDVYVLLYSVVYLYMCESFSAQAYCLMNWTNRNC